VSTEGDYARAFGILAVADDPGSPIGIVNSGSVFAASGAGTSTGIYAYSNSSTMIVNSGFISASSLRAIEVGGAGDAQIYNAGTITGYVLLDADDLFVNQSGGRFEARLTSDFGPGTDLFRNEAGGTVHALEVNGMQPSFVNLERFENQGLISTVDGSVDDVFTIANTLGGSDLEFVASGKPTLAVDALLGGPGSVADIFFVDGDVTGVPTRLSVNNTSTLGGALNKEGIPVMQVTGAVAPDALVLPEPIDAGFFVYELFFEPGAISQFELRSGAPGSSAFILPQLVTASQDIWHASAGTWFDRSADLRVLLNGGGPGMAGGGAGHGAQPMRAAPPIDRVGYSIWGQSVLNTPAVWAKGSGTWLDRDGRASSSAFGSTFNFNLNRDLDVFQLESGIDMGVRGLFSERDTLVFGLLGGFIASSLDYDKVNAQFDYRGGEVGGYATYLNGGWFVDTLVKVDLLEVEATAAGFPDSFDSTTWGFRTDTGYRFGGWRGGAFIEPLATIEVIWADVDDFTRGWNRIAFDDEANVRGRLGLRAGLSQALWSGITMEPFVIGSVWGNLDGDNQASLTSFGTPFLFTDDIPDVWGEASLGVNFFSPGALTALYAKADVSFGDDLDGLSGKVGARVNW
jgi:outer membrane autotransporter protein